MFTAVCSEVRINSDVIDLVFSNEVVGSVRPGSLDHFKDLRTIRWGECMTEIIKPGTIPKQCTALLLPASYKHPFSTSEFHPGLWVYIHVSNLKYAPSDSRPFNVWSETRDVCIPRWQWAFELPRKSSYYDEVYMCETARVTMPKPVYMCSYTSGDHVTYSLYSSNEPAEPYDIDIDLNFDRDVDEPESSDESSESEEYDELDKSDVAGRLSELKVSRRDLARMVTVSRIASARIAKEKAIEIAESIRARLMKAVDDATVHLGFSLKLRFRVRADHVADIIELLNMTFPFIVIDQRKRSLTIRLPAAE